VMLDSFFRAFARTTALSTLLPPQENMNCTVLPRIGTGLFFESPTPCSTLHVFHTCSGHARLRTPTT
jgi:hypothetical protein